MPVVPGVEGDDVGLDAIRAFGDEHGYPVVIKAVAGGGGQGHARRARRRRARGRRSTPRGARREAAFGDDRVLVERYLERPRHIEVQVLADAPRHRRAPRRARVLPAAPPPEGRRGGAVAGRRRRAARAHGRGRGRARARRAATRAPARSSSSPPADGGEFFFLEMNTRLQVEHPGHRARLRRRPRRAAAARRGGRAAARSRRPRCAARPRGRGAPVRRGPGQRLPARDRRDPALALRRAGRACGSTPASATGSEVGTDYDPMLAQGDRPRRGPPDRAAAARPRAGRAASCSAWPRTPPSPARCSRATTCARASIDTGLLERVLARAAPPRRRDDLLPAAALAAFRRRRRRRCRARRAVAAARSPAHGEVRVARATRSSAGGRAWTRPRARRRATARCGSRSTASRAATPCAVGDDAVWIARDGHHLEAAHRARARGAGAGAPAGSLEAPMPGTVLLVHVADGDDVAEGDVLLVLESMKMELSIAAPHAGTVDGPRARAGRPRRPAPAAARVVASGDGRRRA